MSVDAEILEAFLSESQDLLERADADLRILAERPDDAEALGALFRSLHTLKGSTGLFDLSVLTALLHEAESSLETARRDGRLARDSRDLLILTLDRTHDWVAVVAAAAEPSDALIGDTATLTRRFRSEGGEIAASAPEATMGTPSWVTPLIEEAGDGPGVALWYRPAANAFFRGDDPMAVVQGLPGVAAVWFGIDDAANPDAPYDPFSCRLDIRVLCAAPEPEVRTAVRLVADEVEVFVLRAASAPAPSAAQDVRVPAARLDAVAALVDELVVAKNALQHTVSLLQASQGALPLVRELARNQATLERLVGDAHGAVSDLRMISLRGLFMRFPRYAREIAGKLGKPVAFTVEGEDTVLDRSSAEALFEPLLHLLRNAIDHGVESPDGRQAADKPPTASVRLSARPHGDTVVIDLADDGRGVDTAALRALAVKRGLMTARAAAALSEDEAAELIFGAGVSTAQTLSDLSGRGVGMDAVRDTVTRLGGRIVLTNRPGAGLSVSIVLPARTVLTRILVVEAGDQRFGVPMSAIAETHRVRSSEITTIRSGRAYVRRDLVHPLVRLADLLRLEPGPDRDTVPVLALAGVEEAVGVQVDALGARIEAPLRPLAGLLAGYPGVLGTVLEGDGRVLLVLDLAELAA